MERQRYWLVILMAVLLFGCSLPSLRRTSLLQSTAVPTVTSTATPTSTATSTPAPASTATPTNTATSTAAVQAPTATATATPEPEGTSAFKVYDLTDVRIFADDLPSGFIPFDISAFGMDVSEFGDGQYDIENFDFYLSMFPPEFAFTFLIQAKSEAEQTQVDALLDNPEAMLDEFASQIGELTEQEVLTDLPEVGDKSTGMSVGLVMGGQEYQVDMIVFRRESVVGFAGSMHSPGRDARASVADIAVLLDERLQVAIEAQ